MCVLSGSEALHASVLAVPTLLLRPRYGVLIPGRCKGPPPRIRGSRNYHTLCSARRTELRPFAPQSRDHNLTMLRLNLSLPKTWKLVFRPLKAANTSPTSTRPPDALSGLGRCEVREFLQVFAWDEAQIQQQPNPFGRHCVYDDWIWGVQKNSTAQAAQHSGES